MGCVPLRTGASPYGRSRATLGGATRPPTKAPEKWRSFSKNCQKWAFQGVLGRGTYRIFLAAQFYVDPLSFIEFGEFSCGLVSKYSQLSSQHGFGADLNGEGLNTQPTSCTKPKLTNTAIDEKRRVCLKRKTQKTGIDLLKTRDTLS